MKKEEELSTTEESEFIQSGKLKHLIMVVVGEEKFEFEEKLADIYNEYFIEIDSTSGDRCVDGRTVVEKIKGQSTGYDGKTYNGAQIPGATLGELDVLKKILGLNEKEGRSLIKKTYVNHNLKMAVHTDDDHGNVTSLDELKSRKKGCGDQGAKTKSLLPMFEGQEYGEDLLEDRINWIATNDGEIYPLSGEHEENLAVLNLIENTTFNTSSAVVKNESIFSCDVAEIYKRAGYFYDEINSNPTTSNNQSSKADFQNKFTQEIVRNYFQTLVALNQPARITIRS